MTRRERLEKRLEQRQEWEAKRRAKAAHGFSQQDRYRGDVAFNTQPGHIPERARVIRAVDRAIGDMKMADHHAAKADGIARQLDTSIFSDDPDAIEALQAKVAGLEATQERMKAANAAIRRNAKAGPQAQVTALVTLGYSEGFALEMLKPDFAGRIGFASYQLTNNNANIRRLNERIKEIQRRQHNAERAEAAGGVLIQESADYASVTFAEKPDRQILNDLRAAGFHWSGSSWCGKTANIPLSVRAFAQSD